MILPKNIRQAASSYANKKAKDVDDIHLALVEAFITGYCYEHPQPCILDDNIVDISFEDFWREYDYKKAKPQALRMWKRLSRTQQIEVMDSLPRYIASTPDKQYRMHPATYLNPNNERWKDEITPVNNKEDEQKQRLTNYASAIASITNQS